jgi:hypothetical protein
MPWISKEESLRDYPSFLACAGKGVTPVDAPGCSPYLNRPLRRYEDVAADRKQAIRPGRHDEGAADPAMRGERPREN